MKVPQALITTTLAMTLFATSANAASVLYNISSFNNDGSTSPTDRQWLIGKTTITVASGLTGTDDAGLVTLQNLQSDPTTASRTSVPRFMNAFVTGTTPGVIVTDTSTGRYFQFGIAADSGNTIDLASLTFQTTRATTGTATRGYSISVSVDGGSYSLLGADSNVTNNRTNGLQNEDLSLAAMQFQGVSSVDFRVSSTGGGMEYINFAINGDVVPEPSTLLLSGLGVLVLLRRRR
jgi:hypothetical protein